MQLKAKLGEYDEHYKLSETATSYLQAGIDRAHKSVDEVRACVCVRLLYVLCRGCRFDDVVLVCILQLKELGGKLKQKGSDGKETVVDATKASLDKVHAALESLKQSGRDYDQKFKVCVFIRTQRLLLNRLPNMPSVLLLFSCCSPR